jgi:hypothetical protein
LALLASNVPFAPPFFHTCVIGSYSLYFLKGAMGMADTFSGQIIDAWAQPVLKEGLLPEVVRLFQQSGSAHMLGKDLTAEQFVQLMDEAGVGRVMLSAWHWPGKWVISNDTVAAMVLDAAPK